jgi:hypothetical protein
MIEIQFRLVLDPKAKMFVFTFGDNPLYRMQTPMGGTKKSMGRRFKLTALETEQIVKNARKQLADATDAMIEFTFEIQDYKVNFNGNNSRQAFQALVEYLEQVWEGFRGSSYYAEVYPQ